MDLYRERYYDDLLDEEGRREIEEGLKGSLRYLFDCENIFISAKTKENVNELRRKILEMVKEQYEIRYPYRVRQWS
jgi:GTP-binding protein HflX